MSSNPLKSAEAGSALIELVGAVSAHPEHRLADPVSFRLNRGEHVAIVGDNGVGKSRLVDYLLGRFPLKSGTLTHHFTDATRKPYEQIKYIAFRDAYGAGDETYYYQQRWNSTETDHSPTVREALQEIVKQPTQTPIPDWIAPLLEKRLVMLSSGEMRRFQLYKALCARPRILIIDNPYIGLDVAGRTTFTQRLTEQAARPDLSIIVVLPTSTEIPPFITRNFLLSAPKFPAQQSSIPCLANPSALGSKSTFVRQVINMRNVTIRYGQRTILHDINWQVQQGERWALSGANGSGKSTLLSLICADNPQGYACDITLFGRRRGTGESIWDIKRHIGYVSPEMLRAYRKSLPALDIVASGLHDSIGLYVKPRPESLQQCLEWMRLFGLEHLANRPFPKLSSGEQHLVLLTRAFVKSPDLLILDEPMHGLDPNNKQRVRQIIQDYMADKTKTLIMVTHYEEELPPCITHRLCLS